MAGAIETRDLIKRYETTVALNGITLDVQTGEIMGFLGPNGAGKTTTLRMLTGLLSPTSGTIRIEGLDVETKSLEIRRRIGYLPENISLYPELRVAEFLAYRAKLKGVSKAQRRARVAEAIERCSLGEVQRKLIGRLSKGYRQRTGLADCLVGHPSILILDEPTVGLDPHQIRQTRQVIKELGQSSTVFLSTHILPEVEMICQRVTIINRGVIVAVDTPENLRRRMAGTGLIHVQIKGDETAVEQALRQLPGVTRVVRQPQSNHFAAFEVEVEAGQDIREAIFQLAVDRRWILRQLSQAQASLEDVFIHLTTHEQGSES